MTLPPELFPEAISPKQIIFVLMTLGYFVVAIPAVIKFAWVEKVCVAGIMFMAINPVDVTFFSYTNYRGDIRGIEFGVTDWLTLTLFASMYLSPRWKRRTLFYTSPNMLIMWAYFIWCGISIFAAIVPQFAFFGFTRIVRGYLLFWVALNYLRSEEDLRFVIWCVVGISIYSFIGVLMDKYVRGVFPPRGSFPHQNTLATFQNFMNFIVFAVLLGDSKKMFDKTNLIYWIGLGAGTLTNLATLSRGGLATMVLGYGMTFIMLSFLKTPSVKAIKKWKAVSLMFVASLPALAFILPAIIKRFETAPEESAHARDLFNIAAEQMGNTSIFGIGLNNYSFVGSQSPFAEFLGILDAGGLAHHIYWLHYAELGPLGPMLWIALMVGFIFYFGLFILKREDNIATVFTIGVMTGFIIAMLIGTLEWNFRQSQMTLTYLMFAAFTLSLPRLMKDLTKEKKREALKKKALMLHLLSTE